MDNSTTRSEKYVEDCSLAVLLEPNQMSPKQVELLEAARKNDVERLEKLLSVDHVSINTRNNLDRTALHWAAANGNREVIEVLVRASANVNVPDKYGSTPLLLAAWYGHVAALEQLIKNRKTVVNCHNKQGMNIIHCAAVNDHINILEFLRINQLLDKNTIDINKQDERGKTPIQLAAEKGHTDAVYFLLGIGCNPSLKDQKGRTALHSASADGHDEIVSFLIKSNADDVNLPDDEGLTALHLASASGHYDVVRQLIEADADINLETKKSMTALMLSVAGGHVHTTSCLVKNPLCDRNHQDNDGNSAVHLSSANSDAKILRHLIASGCDVNLTNKVGQSALHIAAEAGHTSAVFLLLTSHSHLAQKDNAGKTALDLASRANAVSVVDMIIKQERLEMFIRNCETMSEYEEDLSGRRRGISQETEAHDVIGNVHDKRAVTVPVVNSDSPEFPTQAVGGRESSLEEVEEGSSSDNHFAAASDPTHNDNVSIPDSNNSMAMDSTDGAAGQEVANDVRVDDSDDEHTHSVCKNEEQVELPPGNDQTPVTQRQQRHSSLSNSERYHDDQFSQSGLSQIVLRSISSDHLSAMKTILWKLATKKIKQNEWKKLARYWEFTEEQIRAIEHQYTGPKSYRDHTYRMMLIWLESYVEVSPESSCNPLRGLYDGLVAINRRTLAERIRNKCNKQTETRKSCTVS